MPSQVRSVNITAPHYLLERFMDTPWFHEFMRGFEARLHGPASDAAEAHLENLANPSIKALVVAALFERLNQPVVVVCPDPQTAVKYEFELKQFLSDNIERYPAEDFSPYDLSVFPVQALKSQYEILKRLEKQE